MRFIRMDISVDVGGGRSRRCVSENGSLAARFFFFIAHRVFYYNKSLCRDTDCLAYRPRSKT